MLTVNAHFHHPLASTLSVHEKEKINRIYRVASWDVQELASLPSLSSLTCPFTVGLHPWKIDQMSWPMARAVLAQGLSHPLNCGLGEIGLDRSQKYKANLASQLEVLSELQHFICSNQPSKAIGTIVWHVVDAWGEVEKILAMLPRDLIHLFHDYSGSVEWAAKVQKNARCFFSFSPRLAMLAKRQMVLQKITADWVLLETDDHPEQEGVELLKLSAQLRKCSLAQWQQRLEKNFKAAYPRYQCESDFSRA